jgi:pimeloyl-ACP methyl ester carboxylesterase
MPYLRLHGANLYYEVHGDGVPLIFSHGLGGSVQHVQNTVSGLHAKLILYDNRAHGRTVTHRDSPPLSFSLMASDMAALLDHLHLEQAVLGGVSMGAGVALACTLRWPGRFSGLVLSRPAWLDRPHPANLAFTRILANLLERYSIADAISAFKQTPCYMELRNTSEASASSLLELIRSSNPAMLSTAYRSMSASTPVHSIDEMRKVNLPTLVIGNHNDAVHSIEIAQCWANTIPGALLRIIPSKFDDGEGHAREFRNAVKQFLENYASRS